jgi:hypothetical protein
LVKTKIQEAIFNNCKVYGLSAWGLSMFTDLKKYDWVLKPVIT